jgi:hypothetical protein
MLRKNMIEGCVYPTGRTKSSYIPDNELAKPATGLDSISHIHLPIPSKAGIDKLKLKLTFRKLSLINPRNYTLHLHSYCVRTHFENAVESNLCRSFN